MNSNSYISNRQKLLFMVKELHELGFGNLRVIPSLSPSGMHWRCSFVSSCTKKELDASEWLYEYEEANKQTISPEELTKAFLKDKAAFLDECKGENEPYTEWYSTMVQQLADGELPYAYSDYFSPDDHWRTSAGRQIKTLPEEKEYYR